jgi:hypothetical protein
MRSIAALLLIATAATANNPPPDAPDVEKTASISTPQDCTFGYIFPVQKTDRAYEITVSGKLYGYDKMPSSVLLTFTDTSGKVLSLGIVPVSPDGAFEGQCEFRSESLESYDTHFVRLNMRVARPACEEFLFVGIVTLKR